jgi:modulator of FtsH protease HflC
MKNTQIAIYGVVALLALIVFGGLFYTVDETEQAIITQFGEPIGDPVTQAGLHVKTPFIQVARKFDKRILEWDGNPKEIPTRDKKYIWVDTTGRWRIKDPLKFFQSVHDTRTALSRIGNIVNSATRDAVTSHVLIDIVRDSNREFAKGDDDVGGEGIQAEAVAIIEMGREKITRSILTQASTNLNALGIELIDVRIKRINYITTVLRNVYERMISERKRIAELYRSEGQGKKAEIEGQRLKELERITSEAYRDAQVIRGEADAEATRIYAEAFNKDPDFYSFLRTLESYEASFDEGTSLIMTTNSEYMKFLKGIGKTAP